MLGERWISEIYCADLVAVVILTAAGTVIKLPLLLCGLRGFFFTRVVVFFVVNTSCIIPFCGPKVWNSHCLNLICVTIVSASRHFGTLTFSYLDVSYPRSLQS